MLWHQTLHQSDSLTQHREVALADTFHIIGNRQLRTLFATLHVGVVHWRHFNASIHLQSSVLSIVFGMLNLMVAIVLLIVTHVFLSFFIVFSYFTMPTRRSCVCGV